MSFSVRSAMVQLARVGVCAIALYCAALGALHLSGFSFAAVSSDSMAPTANRGDLLLLTDRIPRAGDFVLFSHRGERIVHRLVRVTSSGQWITRGDANPTDDPWKVDSRDIHGVAIGVIRGFGFPVLWRQGVLAKFTKQISTSATTTSTYWQQSVMTWSVIQNSNLVTYRTPNYVSFAQSGSRKIWITTPITGAVHAHFYGKLSVTDLTQGGFTIITNACSNVSDSPNCGLALSVNTNLKQLQLRTVANDILSKVVASASFSVSFSSSQHLSFYHFGNNVEVMLNGQSMLHITNLATLLQTNNLSMPTGSNCGLWFNNGNRATDVRMNFW